MPIGRQKTARGNRTSIDTRMPSIKRCHFQFNTRFAAADQILSAWGLIPNTDVGIGIGFSNIGYRFRIFGIATHDLMMACLPRYFRICLYFTPKVTHLHSRTLIFTWNRNQKKSVVNLPSSLDTFKNRLHRFWGNQDVKYDYTAELTGAGSR